MRRKPGRSVLARLAAEVLRFRGLLAATLVSLASLAAAQLSLTWLAKLWTDAVLGGPGAVELGPIRDRAALVMLAFAASLFASRYLLATLGQRLVESLRSRAQRGLVEADLRAVRRAPAGDLVSRVVNDTGAVSGFAETVVKRIAGEGLVLAGAVTMMLLLEWRLALVTFIVAPLLVLVVALLARVVRRIGAATQQELGRVSAVVTEEIAGLTTIKGYGAEGFEARRFAERAAAYRERFLASERSAGLLFATVWLVTGLGLIGVLGYGSELERGGSLSPAALLSFALYAVQTIEPIRRISEVQGLLQRTLASAARVYELIDLEPEDPGRGRPLPSQLAGEIRLESVDFAYESERAVLSSLDLVVRPGEPTAVVAASGGGKTTLARLLARFEEPSSGRVTLDGLDLRELDAAALRRSVVVVEQEPFLFAGTVAENLAYGSWDRPAADVARAIRLTDLGALVAALPGGLEARLDEGGRNLSGGQRQRLSLARAIVRDPAVLILDEATSALDGETEARIFERLLPWLAERTAIVMAHRLATVSRLPRVVVLEDGRVAADGLPVELVGASLAFEKLFADQVAPLDRAK